MKTTLDINNGILDLAGEKKKHKLEETAVETLQCKKWKKEFLKEKHSFGELLGNWV